MGNQEKNHKIVKKMDIWEEKSKTGAGAGGAGAGGAGAGGTGAGYRQRHLGCQ